MASGAGHMGVRLVKSQACIRDQESTVDVRLNITSHVLISQSSLLGEFYDDSHTRNFIKSPSAARAFKSFACVNRHKIRQCKRDYYY